MRMSCNGCRVLRKGCSQDCVLRPSIQWINSSESQANATLFLAKFYGRAGLINLINAGPAHLRHVIFGSLLYEACGRVINPVHGSVGLMSSGNWPQCQAAVEAVLQGRPLVMQVSSDDDSSSAATDGHSIVPLKSCDIRHISKDSAAANLHRVKTRHRFKRSVKKHVDSVATEFINELESKFTITGWNSFEDHNNFDDDHLNRAPSHDSFSVETVEPALINRDELFRGVKPVPSYRGNGENDIELELTLGLNPVGHTYVSTVIDISNGES